jgi:dihydrofolate reductase
LERRDAKCDRRDGDLADGFVAPAEGAPDDPSVPEDPAFERTELDWLQQVGTHATGRVTDQEMGAHWPSSTDGYPDPMNELPKVVFPRTLDSMEWVNSRVARRDLADEIARLPRQPGGDVAARGGASSVHALSRAGLVDEYRPVIKPVALGDGLPLVKGLPAPIMLELAKATAHPSGAALYIYRPRERASPGSPSWARGHARAARGRASSATGTPRLVNAGLRRWRSCRDS